MTPILRRTRLARVLPAMTLSALAGAALICATVAGPAVARAATARAATARAATTHLAAMTRSATPAPARLPRCTSAQAQAWLGVGSGGGTAGTIYYPLEFSNVSHRACALRGYPRVAAYDSRTGHRLGRSARRARASHRVLWLRPGHTVHALLGIVEAGNICPDRMMLAGGLIIRGPGQHRRQSAAYPFWACPHRSVLVIGPLRPGTGIPGQ